jgi:predicted RNA binding protein YcfA (HicA-like mRNA interferase family)
MPKSRRHLRGTKGRDAVKAFLKAGGKRRKGKGDHINIKMPNGQIITIPGVGEVKEGLLKAAIKKASLTEEEFLEFL